MATIAAGALRAVFPLGAVMVVGGAAWVSFMSLFNVQVLSQAPDWVRARVLAISMLVFQGAVAAGSATWGAVAAHVGLNRALLWAGMGAILSAALALFLRLSDATVDLTPWNHWRIRSLVPMPICRPDTRDRGIRRSSRAGPGFHRDHARIRTRPAPRRSVPMGNLSRPRNSKPLPRNIHCQFVGRTPSSA